MPEQKYSKATEDIKNRFESLPEVIRKELTSSKTSELIEILGHNYGLGEEKVSAVAQIVGEVLLGYLLPEEMAQELNAFFDIRLDIADKITNELNQKVFSAIKNELGKIYNPIELPEEAPEIPLIRRTVIPVTKIPQPPLPPKPAPPAPLKPAEPKIDLQSFEIKGPSPFMLHQETASYPTPQEISKPKMAAHIELTPTQPTTPTPPRPAVIKLEAPPRVVHYSNLRTPLEEKPAPAKSTLPPLPAKKELESSREQERLGATHTKIVNYSGPNTPLTAAGTPKPEETNTVDLRKMFKTEPKPDGGIVDLRKK
ncbi:MAG: hypothetical protein HZB99_04355 [Candidatus Harrisonbacteria bacterium]|nr:hypothetical protein [Candidatus Harrisonbacteria bacterium]